MDGLRTACDDAAMTPFHRLSPQGKLRRLRALAEHALRAYDLPDPTIVYHGFETNLMYRVRAGRDRWYMMRLASPGWRTLVDLRSEAMWLEALARDTTVGAPRVIAARDGRYVVPASVPGVPDPWNVTLMTRIPGRLLGHYLTEENLARMGALFATLHRHAAGWTPPPGFTTRRFEHWLSRGEPNVITGDADSLLPPGDARDTIDRMHRLVEAAYASVDRTDLRVIHCDLWHDNIRLHDGTLHPFDFEDTVLGYRAHDIAMAMLDLLEATDEERYPDLLLAFRSGYEATCRSSQPASEPVVSPCRRPDTG
jgi:Ser/Thr protein kinase RdoA (MazF antagonist)